MASLTEKAKESVKETLVGVDEDQPQDDPKASAQTRATFEENAIEDETTQEKYLGVEQFVNAVAPMGEDYVRISFLLSSFAHPIAQAQRGGGVQCCYVNREMFCSNLANTKSSTRSSAISTPSSTSSPTADDKVASPCKSGSPSTIC